MNTDHLEPRAAPLSFFAQAIDKAKAEVIVERHVLGILVLILLLSAVTLL